MQNGRPDSRLRMIIADDDPVFRKRAQRILCSEVERIHLCETGKEIFDLLAREKIDLLYLDLHLPDIDGMKILETLHRMELDLSVVVITGHSSIDTAVEAIKLGAVNYLCKPVRRHDLLLAAQTVRRQVVLRRENEWLRKTLDQHEEHLGIVGQSESIRGLTDTIKTVGPLDCNVLIQGETGTGKQLVAKAVHLSSKRRDHPFIAVNCGALTDELINNELFGHEKDAFTGASSSKPGLLEAGNFGTVFLDEIGEMAPGMQVKLLHALEERQILRVGATRPVDLDIRVIAATNRDLKAMVQAGSFREDLYFRLNVVELDVPPLNERKEDIPLLISHFLAKYNRRFQKEVGSVSDNVLKILSGYDFPGNVRELENIVQRALALCNEDTVHTRHLPSDIRQFGFESVDPKILKSLADVEKEHIQKVLEFSKGDRKLAAMILGLPRTTLWRRIKQYQLQL